MGEYAMFKGEQIKIGTCEDMYYLRADQARLVKPLSGNVDPVKDAGEIRFRFPFPDEDGKEPGTFGEHDRAITLPGSLLPTDDVVRHYPPCDKRRRKLRIEQQRLVDGKLVLICGCSACRAKFRLATLADAKPIINACKKQGLEVIAYRIESGYIHADAWTVGKPDSFTAFLRDRLGTDKWFVGRWSKSKRERYEVALSPQKYAKLECEYQTLTGKTP